MTAAVLAIAHRSGRHGERSEAIQPPPRPFWIASSLRSAQ
jgi:hypothetical protein